MEFKKITNKNIWMVCSLEVNEEQKDFVADNMQSLAEAYATINEGNNCFPFAIYEKDKLVGFIMIGKGTVGNENESELIKKNYSIWRLMIDKKYQNQGLGTSAIKKALDMIIHNAFNLGLSKYCWLSYEKENVKAKKVYSKIGFKENGEMCGNEIIAVYEFK